MKNNQIKDLRKSVEQLIMCYIPAKFLASFFHVILTNMMKDIMTNPAFTDHLHTFMMLSSLFTSIDNIIVGIWLYFVTKESRTKKILWLLFGLSSHIFAVIIYLSIQIYEGVTLKVNNKTPKSCEN